MATHYFKRKIKFLFVIIAIISTAYILEYLHDMSVAKNQSSLLNEVILSDNSNSTAISPQNSGHSLFGNRNNVLQNSESNTPVGKDDISLHGEEPQKDQKIVEKNERMLKLESLQSENPDIVGWLEIPGTVINYPVLHGSDNNFYLHRNYKKQQTQSGSIFIDVDYNWNTPSTNMIIYGHNMKNGTMFTSLVNYESKTYYDAHSKIRFTTIDNDVTYEIIAAFRSKIYDASDTTSFKYYNFIEAKNKEEFDIFISNIKNISLYDTGVTAEYGDELMTLSTCAYHTKNGRFAVVAKKEL